MSEGECVKVVVRCRPFNSREKGLGCQKIVKIDRRNLSCSLTKGAEEPKTFTYDNVYDDDSLQKDVYDETAFPLVKSVLEGYNGTIFAYGQTGCGKTFTMEGIRSDVNLRGIIPRTFDQIFDHITTANAEGGDTKFLVAVSYVEIYNEEVRDLLGDNPKTKMEVKEDPEKGVFIKNLSYPEVTSVDQIESLMNAGNKNRSVGATAMNATSSRSHSLFTVRIETSQTVAGSDEAHIKAGKLNLVDLAGSERQSKTEATGDRLKEAQKINLSLSALGNVISALVVASGGTKKEPVHIPYRDSKLTRLLQDSLGGNTKTIMIAAVSPASDNYDETLSTLRYANRAKNIKNKPKVNEDPKDAMLREFQDEIKRLKALLESQGLDLSAVGGGGASAPKKKKKKKMNADGVMEASSEEEEEEEEDDEDAVAKPKKVKKVKKVKKPKVEGEVEDITDEEEEEEEDDGEIPDETEGGGEKKRRKKKTAGDAAMSPAERQKLEEAKADFEAELSKINQEKEKHETFARMLEEQMRVEMEQAQSRVEMSQKEKEAALAEIESRLMKEKEEHEARAGELAEEISKQKEEEAAKLAAAEAQIASLQNEALNEKLLLKAKLKKLQQKLIDGGSKHKTVAQEAEEKARLALEEAMKLRQAEAKEREAKVALEEEKLLLEENYTSVKDEVIGKTKKLKKLKKKLTTLQQELDDSRMEWESNKEDLMNQARENEREMKLYKAIALSVLTKSDLEKIVKGSIFVESKDDWQLPRIDLPVFFPTVRLIPGVGQNGGLKNKGAPTQDSAGSRQQQPRGSVSQTSSYGYTSNVSSKFQEEKGSDSGWKKSVTAGYDREEYNPHSNGKAVSAKAQAAAQANLAVRQPSPSARNSTPGGAHAPSRLDALGGGARTPRGMGPDGSRPATGNTEKDELGVSSVARRPAFEGGQVASGESAEESHARLLSVMDSAAVRTSFAPDKKSMPQQSNGGTTDFSEVDAKVMRKAAFNPQSSPTPPLHPGNSPRGEIFDGLNEPTRRPAFNPAVSPRMEAGAGNEDIAAMLANGPAKRAAFSPANNALSSSGSSQDDPLASASVLPKRAAFDPKGGFAPAETHNSALDIMSNHQANTMARGSFQPAKIGGLDAVSSNDPILSSSPPPRASFQPAAIGTHTNDALNFPSTNRAAFQPAKVL